MAFVFERFEGHVLVSVASQSLFFGTSFCLATFRFVGSKQRKNMESVSNVSWVDFVGQEKQQKTEPLSHASKTMKRMFFCPFLWFKSF